MTPLPLPPHTPVLQEPLLAPVVRADASHHGRAREVRPQHFTASWTTLLVQFDGNMKFFFHEQFFATLAGLASMKVVPNAA